MKTIVCGLWKEPEHDYIGDIISWLLKISVKLAKVISLSFQVQKDLYKEGVN